MTTPNKSESSTIEELKTKLQEAEQRNKDLEVKLFEKSSVTSKFSNWKKPMKKQSSIFRFRGRRVNCLQRYVCVKRNKNFSLDFSFY